MEIVSIQRRSAWVTPFTVNWWRVGVKNDEGKVEYYNCWAGCEQPSKENLLWDLRCKIANDIHELVGTKI